MLPDAIRDNASPDPIQALRTATQALHAQLDSQLPLAQPLADAADGWRRYQAHLQVLHGWLQAIAPLLRRAGWGLGYLQTLRSDLADAQAAEAAAAAAPQPDPAFAWGVAYVVEGSQLGGRVLLQRLRQAGADQPLHYLEGRGPATGAHWNGFLKAARATLTQPGDIANACRGACWAFEDLLGRFRQSGLLT